jgi:uncharacterized protein YsxB (DUF464 family)
MTRVTFYQNRNGHLTGFRAADHAGYAETGEDIVCAAVSALTQTVLNGLISVQQLPVDSNIDEEKALLEAVLAKAAGDEEIERAQVLFRTLLEGLQAIERQYPKYVQVLFREWR